MNEKLMTIDEVCGQPEGSFKKFIERQEKRLAEIEEERKNRIRLAKRTKQ